jgi:hypothetical protein
MNNGTIKERTSKAGEWMRNHTEPLIIISDRQAIEALRV